jgi:hypothetical protein
MMNGEIPKQGASRRTGRDPDRLEFKSGGGLQILFGFPFLFVGILAVLTCIGLIPLEGEGGELSIMAAGFFGVVFMAVGGGILFGRSGLSIDRRLGEAVQWRRLVIPIERRVHALDRFDRVRLEIRREEGAVTYPVLLQGKDAAEGIIVEQTADYRQARQTAEELALFLGKPLEDVVPARAGF